MTGDPGNLIPQLPLDLLRRRQILGCQAHVVRRHLVAERRLGGQVEGIGRRLDELGLRVGRQQRAQP
jgi:hypothetical protein